MWSSRLIDEPGQSFPVAHTGGLRAEGFEVKSRNVLFDRRLSPVSTLAM
jgi:hypothetical protein